MHPNNRNAADQPTILKASTIVNQEASDQVDHDISAPLLFGLYSCIGVLDQCDQNKTVTNQPILISDEEFDALFNEALYGLDGVYMFFRKAKHGNSFIRADQ